MCDARSIVVRKGVFLSNGLCSGVVSAKVAQTLLDGEWRQQVSLVNVDVALALCKASWLCRSCLLCPRSWSIRVGAKADGDCKEERRLKYLDTEGCGPLMHNVIQNIHFGYRA